jgi:hypothetical protein
MPCCSSRAGSAKVRWRMASSLAWMEA